MLHAIIGFCSGIVSGMGIGGGTILIPSLVFILGVRQQVAQSVNLVSFIPMAIIALAVHMKNKNIQYKSSLILICFGMIGAYIGSKIAVMIPSDILKKLFGFFLLTMGIYELCCKKNIKKKQG